MSVSVSQKLEIQAKSLKLLSIVVLLIVISLIIASYFLFTSTALDVSSTKIKQIKKEISLLEENNEEIKENETSLKDNMFTKTEIADFENHDFYLGYIREVSNLEYLDFLYIKGIFDDISKEEKEKGKSDIKFYDALKEKGGENLVSKIYNINPRDTQIYNNQIYKYTKKIIEYNSKNPDNQYVSPTFIAVKWANDQAEQSSSYLSTLVIIKIFRRTWENISQLKEFNEKTISTDAESFNQFITQQFKKTDESINSKQEKINELKKDLLAEEERIQKNTFYLYNSILTKVVTSIMLILLVKMFIEIFRYILRLSVLYSTRAHLIELIYELDIDDLSSLKEIFDAGSLDFNSPQVPNILEHLLKKQA